MHGSHLCRGQVLLNIVPGGLLDRGNSLRGAVRLLVLQGALEEELDLLGGQMQGGGALEEAPDARALPLLDLLQVAKLFLLLVLRPSLSPSLLMCLVFSIQAIMYRSVSIVTLSRACELRTTAPCYLCPRSTKMNAYQYENTSMHPQSLHLPRHTCTSLNIDKSQEKGLPGQCKCSTGPCA